MPLDRRHFLTASAAVMGGALTPLGRLAARVSPPRAAAMRVLILGGTSFLGPHQVRYLLERGHEVAIFTRGRTEPTLFAEAFEHVEHLIGDRNGDLTALHGRRWDAVIDNSGRSVAWTRDSAQLTKDLAGRYLYVSSTGVYLPYRTPDIREDTPLVLADDPPGDEMSYGVMKSLSEIEVRQAFGEDRAVIVRPTYIVGPADTSDRFTYWPVRIRRGGTVLVPGRPADPVQFVDVRDLTEWMVHLLERGAAGTFNAAGPRGGLTMAEMVYGIRAVTTTPVEWTWIDDYDFLREQRLRFAIPWLMAVDDWVGAPRINIERAVAAGLTFRPLAVTAADTLDWWYSDAVSAERRRNARFVLTPEREAGILAAWQAR